jgi:hypothetical protein
MLEGMKKEGVKVRQGNLKDHRSNREKGYSSSIDGV